MGMIPHRLHLLMCLLVLAGAGMLSAYPAAAQQGGACPRFGPIQVKIEFQVAQLRRDYGRSFSQLASMPGRAPGPAGASNGHILGLALAKFGENSQLGALVQPMGDGTYCGGANVLTVTFGFQERTIYVARELPQGTCIHNEVLNHEMRHIAVDEQLLRDFGPTIKNRLEATLAQVKPVRARSKDQAMRALRQPVDAALRQLMQEFGRERERRQAPVDTVAEYERVSRSCNGEINRYIPKGKSRL
jgi:hypothetical protein